MLQCTWTLNNISHTSHCADMQIYRFSLRLGNVETFHKFSYECGRHDTGNKDRYCGSYGRAVGTFQLHAPENPPFTNDRTQNVRRVCEHRPVCSADAICLRILPILGNDRLT